MNNLEALQARLADIETEITRIQDQGDVLEGARLELVAPGGTAGSGTKATPKYGRLRQGCGAERTSRYVALAEINEVEAAIARGRQVKALRKERDAIAKKVSRIEMLLAN